MHSRPRKIHHNADANQPDIVDALEKAGFQVWFIEWPLDLLVYRAGRFCVLEVKNRDGKNRATKSQTDFFSTTTGARAIVYDPLEALRAAESFC